MKQSVRDVIDAQLKTLDKENGLGIFPELYREVLPGEKFLIVSYGGTGGEALYAIKKALEKNIDKDEIEKSIRLLSIDTDTTANDIKVSAKDSTGKEVVSIEKKFTPKEMFWIDNGPAKQAIINDDPGMRPWINPSLLDAIRADNTYLDGNGASSTRQMGRLLLFPQVTVNSLKDKIQILIRELTDNNNDRLNVLIVTGIAGGTGSGIVIDATYLIRNVIGKMLGNIASRSKLCGFVLLPPTGKSLNQVDIEKGNRNGIAALKEIDHYMTIAFRDEVYEQNFGGSYIVDKNNIFDTCYLLDGTLTNVAFGNPREKANEVVSECILDMITSLPVANQPGQASIQTVDAFLSDASAYSVAMISNQKEQVAPREANYVYCAIGHGKVLIPVELMKAYVAGETFNKIYNLFLNCGNVTEDDVDNFIDEMMMPVKDFNPQEQGAKIKDAIEMRFSTVDKAAKKGGPFFTINLLNQTSQELDNRRNELEGKALVLDKENKINQINFVKNVILKNNDEIFTVYVEVMEQMKNYFKVEHEVFCDSHKFQNYKGTTYTFSPIDFSNLDEKSKVVKQHLDSLINPRKLDALTDDLIKSMISKRAEWTEAVVPKETGKQPRFNAAVVIRNFWADEIGKIVDSTIEDFLIKYYSGDPNAHYEEQPDQNGKMIPTSETDAALKAAAKEIVNIMAGPAGMSNPLAAMNEFLITKDNFNGHNFFMVPQAAPHLLEAIKSEIKLSANNPASYVVVSSYANDRISCYAQYTGIPAYMFSWVARGEEDYEKFIRSATAGIHMSETKGGNLWRNYPNLVVESIWPRISSPAYKNDREKNINDIAKIIFNKAIEFGAAGKYALANTADFGYYKVFILPLENRPDSIYFKNVDSELEGSQVKKDAEVVLDNEVEKKANELFELADWETMPLIEKSVTAKILTTLPIPINYTKKELKFTNTVMAAYTDPGTPKPNGWEEELGAKLLRTCPELTCDVRGTVLVLEKLYKKINDVQSVKDICGKFAEYLAAGLFTYNEAYYQWSYVDGNREEALVEFEVGNNLQKSAEYFFMFEAYKVNQEKIDNAIASEYIAKINDPDKLAKIEKQKAKAENAKKLLADVEMHLMVDRNNPDQTTIVSSKDFEHACGYKGYNANKIVAFYNQLHEFLKFM